MRKILFLTIILLHFSGVSQITFVLRDNEWFSSGQIEGEKDVEGFYQVSREKGDANSGVYSVRIFDASNLESGVLDVLYDDKLEIHAISKIKDAYIVRLENALSWKILYYSNSFELVSEIDNETYLKSKKWFWFPDFKKENYFVESNDVVVNDSTFLFLKNYSGKVSEDNMKLAQRFELVSIGNGLKINWVFTLDEGKQTLAEIASVTEKYVSVVVRSFEDKGKSCESWLYVLNLESGGIVATYELMKTSGFGLFVSNGVYDDNSNQLIYFGNYYSDSKNSIYDKSDGLGVLKLNLDNNQFSTQLIAWDELEGSVLEAAENPLDKRKQGKLRGIKYIHEVKRTDKSNYCVVIETFSDVVGAYTSCDIAYFNYDVSNGEFNTVILDGSWPAKFSQLEPGIMGSAQIMGNSADRNGFFNYCYSVDQGAEGVIFVSLLNPEIPGSSLLKNKVKDRTVNLIRIKGGKFTYAEVSISTVGNVGTLMKGAGNNFIYFAEIYRNYGATNIGGEPRISWNRIEYQLGTFNYPK